MAGSATGLSAYAPRWAVGDWWTVESQMLDRAENLPGGVPHWLDAETWKFSVDGTNALDGEACYEVSVRPAAQNRCPYWFTYFFRESDLLVLKRQLHQGALGKASRAPGAPAVESTFSKDEETPFVQSDFPNLPVAMPHFRGGATNSYRGAFATGQNLRAGTNVPARSRLFTGTMSQSFAAKTRLQGQPPAGRRSAKLLTDTNATSAAVVKLSISNDKQEKQEWNAAFPWPAYAEKWEFGELVRKSWLTDFGHTAPGATATGGGR